jgi:hypothetical protein
MAERTKAQFKALYGSSGTIFPDNTTGEISEEDMRNFGEDIADSFISKSTDGLNRKTISTASATITLDFESKKEWLFYATPSFATAKTIAVSNATNAIRFTLLFEITNTNGTLTLPSNFMCVDARMVGQVFTPLDIGRYKMRADFDGTNWWVDEFIGLYKT